MELVLLTLEAIHQLDTRSRSTQPRCSECELERFGGMCLFPLQLGTSNHEQGVDRQDRDCCDRPSLAGTNVVATPSEPVNSGTGSTPEQIIPFAESSRSTTGTPDVFTPPSRRISCLLQRYETEGRFKDVANLLVAATRTSTSKTYESRWRRWCRWYTTKKCNPLLASLSIFLSFFADCFKEVWNIEPLMLYVRLFPLFILRLTITVWGYTQMSITF